MTTIGSEQPTLSGTSAATPSCSGELAPARALDPAERERLVREHMPLVSHVVREVLSRVPSHVSREDLTSAGLLALVQVVRSYDPARGVPLGRYAAQRIRGAILDELRGLDWASRSVRRRQRELDRVRAQLTNTLRRSPTVAEVTATTGLSAAEIATQDDDVCRASVLSLQGFGPTGLDDVVPSRLPDPGEELVIRERLAYLHDAIDLLPERLRTVVRGYFLAERPMAELAAELGVTESRISQMRAEALVLMREAMQRALADEPSQVTPVTRCAARRREAYYSAVADRRSVASRLTAPGAVPAVA